MIRRLLFLLALGSTLGAQARVGSISGRIQLQNGAPAESVRVTAIQDGDLIGNALTDKDGRYEIKGIAPGRYLVAAGLIGSFTYLPGTTDESKATPVIVKADAVVANTNFKLDAGAGVRIQGTVGIAAG